MAITFWLQWKQKVPMHIKLVVNKAYVQIIIQNVWCWKIKIRQPSVGGLYECRWTGLFGLLNLITEIMAGLWLNCMLLNGNLDFVVWNLSELLLYIPRNMCALEGVLCTFKGIISAFLTGYAMRTDYINCQYSLEFRKMGCWNLKWFDFSPVGTNPENNANN